MFWGTKGELLLCGGHYSGTIAIKVWGHYYRVGALMKHTIKHSFTYLGSKSKDLKVSG